jgi:hypothetical protein
MLGLFLEAMLYLIAGPMLRLVLGVFGYDLDWDPKDGRRLKGWPLALSAFLCFVVSGVVLGGITLLLFLAYSLAG